MVFNTKPRVKSKIKSKQRNKVNTKKIKSTYDGGSAFAKGGFGCVFKPELSCIVIQIIF